jgi:hypothetical protein
MPTALDIVGVITPQTPEERRDTSYNKRVTAADLDKAKPLSSENNNGDDERYAAFNHYASFSKGLPHNDFGEADPVAYAALTHALQTGAPSDFAAIPLGWPDKATQAKLVDPQSALAFDLECPDCQSYSMPAPPAFNSAEEIGEIAENYWMALTRDIPYVSYKDHPLIAEAAADLSKYSVFNGPKAGGAVTPGTIFRGFTAGDQAGPYLSQFLLRDVPYGSQLTPATIKFAYKNNMDYLTDPTEWLNVQKGKDPGLNPQPIDDPLHIINGRQIAQYVHIDELFQAYLNACLILITPVSRGGFNAPLDEGNPYKGYVSKGVNVYSNQAGFGTLGEPNFKGMVAEIATRALKAAWFQKWCVNRRLRPEAFAGRIHHHLVSGKSYDFHPAEFAKLQSDVLNKIFAASGNKSYLLPMAYPEGCPLHPSYAAGHATVAGACVTMLKALFHEETLLSDLGIQVLEPSPDGKNLQPYMGADKDSLTIGGELDKLASNIGLARNVAGVHWRSDYTQSLLLGEQIALSFLRETIETYNENVTFTIHPFSGGAPVTITK